jgi:hypothetical protein
MLPRVSLLANTGATADQGETPALLLRGSLTVTAAAAAIRADSRLWTSGF